MTAPLPSHSAQFLNRQTDPLESLQKDKNIRCTQQLSTSDVALITFYTLHKQLGKGHQGHGQTCTVGVRVAGGQRPQLGGGSH